AVLSELGIASLDLVSLAKDRVAADARGSELRRSEERVFLPNRKNPVILPRNSTALFLLQRVRDEAHRFAITYHREVRRRERLRSSLDAIPGIGAGRRRQLLRAFGSVRNLAEARVEEVASVPGIGERLAAQILEHLRREAERPAPGKGRLVLEPIGEAAKKP
ncbi:MAG: helix-hairpin-helix domain-containing protein, partial [Candidatus Binatia bacterium]